MSSATNFAWHFKGEYRINTASIIQQIYIYTCWYDLQGVKISNPINALKQTNAT